MKDLIANTADLRGMLVSDPIVTLAVSEAVAEKKSDDKINVVGVGSDEKLVKFLQDDVIRLSLGSSATTSIALLTGSNYPP
jgi:ribose transport system substrate-binding protein